MPRCIVIADDLTGGNATGVLLTKARLRTHTLLNEEIVQNGGLENCDCIIFPTDSRDLEPEAAYSRVFHAAQLLKTPEAVVYSKRIDSTLRGNLGRETDALLDALDNGAVAFAVPSFPQSKRTMVGGHLLVNGIPLHKTEAASDPKRPVTTPLCADIFRKQSKYPVGSLFLGDMLGGSGHMAEHIRELAGQGVRTIVCDAVTQEDIDLIAEAVISSDIPFVAADPGVFTATLARKLIAPAAKSEHKKILVALGSVNGVAARQAEIFLASQKVLNVFMDTSRFLESMESRDGEIGRVVEEILGQCGDYDLCSIIGNGIFPQYRIDFEPYAKRDGCSYDELSAHINDAVAEITRRIFSAQNQFAGLYACGGDIAAAVCRRMKVSGLKLLGEVLPLAGYCEYIGGDFNGLKAITKGGMVGEPDAIVKCVAYLRDKLEG